MGWSDFKSRIKEKIMAKNVKINEVTYQAVPSISIPLSGVHPAEISGSYTNITQNMACIMKKKQVCIMN